MEGRGWPGKRLGLLAQIRAHEDEVEADFRRFYSGLDYRDRYRPGGGPSQLTLRLLLLLVDKLPPESEFKSAVEQRVPISSTDSLLMDVWSALSGKNHTRWDALKTAARRAERESVIRRRRAAAREHNQRALRIRESAE